MGTSNISFISVLLLISVLWNPINADGKCSLACSGSPTTQSFLSGHKYNYGVEGTVTIYLTGGSSQETNVKLLGQVSVSSVGNCVHELDVQNLVISGPDGKKYQSPSGIEKPVRFTLQDGRIGAEICAEEGDTRRSLNIKRAIISLLQTEQKSSTQVDIFGTCPTEVSSSQEGSASLVHRSRDLSRCGHREQGKNELITGVFNTNAEIKDTQVLRSSMNVETKVNNGVPEKVAATEEYFYRPFSVGENGARAKVYTKLTLTGKARAANAPTHCTESRTIIFENPHGAATSGNLQSAVNAVKETAKTLAHEAGSKSAGNFAQLVRILRTNGKDDLMKVYSHVKGGNVEKRVFLDALIRAGTGYSIEASIQLLKNKELGNLEQKLVFLSLGNARHVNNEAIKAAASILDIPNLPKEVYLGVGALAGAYCREHQCHKVKNDGVVALSQKFAAKLQNCRPKNKLEEDNVVAVLKGIRNIRHLEDNLIDKLAHCALDNNVKPRVKAAALEAFQADACAPKLKKTGIDILKNRQLDSEIRIKAYLAVISCPCSHSASEIKKLLDTEPVHQVGNFISSSLRNIRASANPDKQLARQHYGLIRTPNKFNSDIRKYSFSAEESFNIDALGLGGNIERNVIYSQDSFLPRSGTMNLTAEVFGHSLNILEVGARQGNLDRVLEHFIGPKGFFNTEDLQHIYKEHIVAPLNEYEKEAEGTLSRGRRSVKSDVDTFDKNLKAESQPYNNELDLDLYVKLFGTDAVFLSLGDGKGFDMDKLVQQFLQYVEKGIDGVKNFQQEVRAHLLFLDAELSYPTSTGLPLKLDLIGSATGRFEASTNIDIRQCLKAPQDAKISIKLVPSTDIEVTGALFVDADAIAAGLKVIVNLHSSTGGHVVAKVLEGGRGFDLQFGLPIDKQEIITASNDLVYFYTEKGQLEKHTVVRENVLKETSACFDQAAEFLGLTVCGEVSVPFTFSGPDAQASISRFVANYPLSGSAKVRLTLEKQNVKGYHIKGLLRNDGAGRQGFELLFDAQGAKSGHAQLSGEYVYNQREVGAQFALESPFKAVSAQVTMTRSPSELTLLAKGKIDTQEVYGKVGFNVQGGGQRKVYKPIAEMQMPGSEKQIIPISGQVIEEVSDSKRKYTIEGIKVNLPSVKDPICIDGHVTLGEQNNFEFDTTVKDMATLKGSLKNSEVTAEFTNKLNPYINFKLKGHFEYSQVVRNDLDIVYGPDLRNTQNRIVFGQMYKYHKGSGNADFSLISKNKFEIYAIPVKTRFDIDVDSKKLDVEAVAEYMNEKAEFDLEARTQIKKPNDYSIKLKAGCQKQGIEVFSKRDIVSADKSNFENYVLLKGVGKYELSGVVLHKVKPNDMNVGAVGYLKTTVGSQSQEINFDVGVIETATLYSSHAKVSESQVQYLDFLLKFNRGANANGQLKLIVKDAISANGQFKVTDNDGKGNGVIIVYFKKSQRKIKGDVKFMAKAPNYSADFDLYLNFEKDNKDKVHFSTNSKQNDKLFDSKNKFEYNSKKFELNVKQEGLYSLVGKTHGLVELVLPTERCLTFKVNRDITRSNDAFNGHAEVVLSDAAKRGGAASTITYKGKIVNTNWEKDTVNYDGQLELKLNGGKKLLNTFSIKNNPEGGDKFKFELKSDVTGDLLPKPFSLSSTYDYLDSFTTIDDKYRVKASYGDDISLEWSGVQEAKFLEQGEKKYLDDYTVTVRLPFDKAHDIKWVNTILYVQPENKNTIEYTIVEMLQVNADVYKIDSNGKVGPQSGYGTFKLIVPHADPLVLDVKYKNDHNNDKTDSNVELKAKYGKGKTASIEIDTSVAPRDNNVRIKANAPGAEKLKRLEFSVRSKNPTPDTYISNVVIDADGRIYKSDSSIVFSKAQPLIDIKYTSPSNSKTSRLYIKGNSLSSTQGKVELKVENIREISLDLNAEGNIQKDNVAFKLAANSDQLGWKNYNVEIASKDAGSGKRLEFKASNNNQNILSGSTSFISKQEGPKMIIEGSGAVKLKEEQKSANFKYIRTILGEGNEKGVETFFNMAIGERSYVAESRVTNLEYKNSVVYCEEKKQCAHAELNSKIDISKPGVVQNIVSAGFDLRKLGIAPEFGLMIKDEVSDKRLPQYTMDVHINKEDKKYHLHVYNTPEYGNGKSGITIQLPQRVLALESVVTYPTNKGLPFPIRGEVYFDMDKNKQGHKTSARFLVDLVTNDKQQSAVAEFGFNHPKLSKEALLRIRGVMQQPAQNQFKLETSAALSHPALGADRESKILLEGSPNHIKFLVNTPLVKVIDVEGSATVNEREQKAEVKFCLLEGKPVQVYAIARDYQYFEFTTEESDRKLSVVSHIQPEKRVDISADIILGKEKKNIANGALFLDDNLIKSEYGLSKDNFQYFLNALKKDLELLDVTIVKLGDQANNDFKNTLKRLEPTLNNIEKAYTEDLQKFYQEIADDKAIKAVSQALNDIVQYVAKIIDEVMTATKPLVDSIKDTYVNFAKKVQEMYEKQIEPQIKQIYATLASAAKEYLDSIIELIAQVSAIAKDFFDKHRPELEELTNTLTNIFKDLTRLLVAQIREYRTRVTEWSKDLSEQLKELPFVTLLKEKWEELAVPEQGISILQNIYGTLEPLLPTPETADFARALNSYIVKKLNKEKCNDEKELRAIYQKFFAAVTSLYQLVRSQLAPFTVDARPGFNQMSFLPGDFSSVPSLGGSAAASPLTQLLNGDFPDVLALVRAYRPRSFNPLDEIPAKLRAVVVNGQHIFTFDGRHLTFPGNCRYVLAHDHVDRNFTLVMQLADGAPKALILEDKSGAILELKDNGQVQLNGANHGFPIIEKDSFAFRQANGRIGLGSLYGIMTFCTSKLEVCYIEVNGFYLGKLRGLLGDGNNEPYDDFKMPNGKICKSESEFGNSYRLTRSCAQVQAPEHNHHQMHHMALPPACEQVFGGTSPLRPLGLILDIAPFRQACIHACTGNSADALRQACDLARGYTALAVTGLLPAVLPDVCVQCTDADKPRSVGETYELKVNNKQADIIIAVETTTGNEKTFKTLVVPLVSQLVDTLKKQQCNDVKVYLVGVTSKYPYPIIYDTDAKLKNAKVQFDDKSRYQYHNIQHGSDPVLKVASTLTSLYDALIIEFGLTNVIAGHTAVLDLPLRAGASKHVLAVIGEECVSEFFLVEVGRSVLFSVFVDDQPFTHSIVAPTPLLKIGGGKNYKQIVGYTENAVIMLGDKKVGKEAENIRSTLETTPDACRDFYESTDGIIFSSTNFHNLDEGQKKQYLQTATAAITHRLLHETMTQKCTCSYVDPFRVRSLCVAQDRKEVARRRK